jgi:hypothetical protein
MSIAKIHPFRSGMRLLAEGKNFKRDFFTRKRFTFGFLLASLSRFKSEVKQGMMKRKRGSSYG